MIIGQYHPRIGGAERECRKLSGRLLKGGSAVSILTQSGEGLPDHEVIDGIPVYRKMKGGHLYEYTYMLSVAWFLLRHIRRYDIIQCFGLYLFIPPAALIARLFKKRAVARVEGAGSSGDFYRIGQLQCGRLILDSAKRLDRIIAISGDISRELQERGFPDRSVVGIPNSVDVDLFCPGKGARKQGVRQICFIGRLAEEKGVRYLLRAMGEIRKEWKGVKLFIAGDGPVRGDLEELSRQLGVMDDTVFAGHREDVLPCYQQADLFVLPSLAEGLSLSLLEALSCGLPVIATAVGGSGEVLDPRRAGEPIAPSRYRIAEYGVLVNPGDVAGLAGAVLRLLRDGELSAQLRERARRHVRENYALDGVIARYRTLYAELLGTV